MEPLGKRGNLKAMALIEIDGAQGEGGGQVLRSALSLSLVTGVPVRLVNIRARRRKPGLQRQHLAAVRAAAQVGQARVEGAALDARELTFEPGGVREGEYHFAVGSAGSATLVFQTVFPALALARGPSRVTVEGGTHNPLAPPFEFLERAYLPLVARMGPRCRVRLAQAGFYPAGKGRIEAAIEPAPALGRLELLERGALRACRATAVVARLPLSIAERELAVVREHLRRDEAWLSARSLARAASPGNYVSVEIESEHLTEVFTGFGQRGVRAEEVGSRAAREAAEYLAAPVPVGRHLADQLLLPMALGQGGRFRTLEPSDHLRTHADLLRQVLGVQVHITHLGGPVWEVEVPASR